MRFINYFYPHCRENIQRVISYTVDILIEILAGILCWAKIASYYALKIKNRLFPSKQKRKPQKASSLFPITVQFDDSTIKTTANGADHESVEWQDVENVVISIEDDFLPMPYWYIGNGKVGIRIPNDAIGGKELLDEFTRRLPGYNCDETYRAIIEAMAAIEGDYMIWRSLISGAPL